MKSCKVCDETFEHHNAYANHVRWKHKREQSQIKCPSCDGVFEAPNFSQHYAWCTKEFNTCQRLECGKKTRNPTFCSKNCAAIVHNTSGVIGYKKYRQNRGIQRQTTYRDICFQHWDKQCALCDWDKCLDVHHVNDDHHDDRPENLIPLCQNHHMLTRVNEHREDVRSLIDEKIREKFGAITQRACATSAG